MTPPLFIPLIAKYYEQFERGEKFEELRIYGKRWNDTTCYVGRSVVLSKGYGKKYRMNAVITKVDVKPAINLSLSQQKALLICYGRLDMQIIIISLRLL